VSDQLKRVMSDVFRLPVDDIPDDAVINELTGWDSLRHVELMLAIEMTFGVQLTVYEMHDLISYEIIDQFLQERGVQPVG